MAGKETIDWDLGKAPKQSITEVLQDPRGPSIELPDISSIDLAASSLSLTPVTPSSLPSALNINHFETYLRRYGPLYATYRHNVQQPRNPSATGLPGPSTFSNASSTEDGSVPSQFFDPSFDVAAYPPLADLQHKPDEPLAEHPDLPRVRDELVRHQRKLEHQLTSVLHEQSGRIDTALQNMRSLRETLLDTATKLRHTRSQAAALVPQVAAPIACICALTTAQENVDALLNAANDLQTAIAAPGDVNVLLEAGAYAAAIDRVIAARRILKTPHLTGVHALFPVRHQLANAIETIDTALRREFRSALYDADEAALSEVVILVHRIGRVSLLLRFFTKEITEGLSAQLSETTGLAAVARIVRTAAERAAILSRIVHNCQSAPASHGSDALLESPSTSREFSGTEEESRREMLVAFEELLAIYVDSLWPPFEPKDGESVNAVSYIILTKDTALREETCFDEFKAAHKFGEEVLVVEEIATDIETQFAIAKKGSTLRAKISERLTSFVSAFHRAHVDTITNAVRTDKWQEVSVSIGAVRLLDAVVSSKAGNTVKVSSESPSSTGGKGPESALVLDGETQRTAACGVRYIRSACAYALLAEQSPTLGAEVSRRGTELSRVFNTLVWKAILGVAAIQWSGLRSITARHLSLASRTITLAALVARHTHKIMEPVLMKSSKASVVVPLMRKVEKDLDDHHTQLISKIIEIMLDRLRAHEESLKALPWGKQQELMRFDIPSGYILTLGKETAVLHRILWHVLPQAEAIEILKKVWAAYGATLSEAYGSLDGGRAWIRERVARDVKYLYDSFLKLELSKVSPEAFKPIAQLYKRFAKEFLEDAATGERAIPTISGLDSRSSVPVRPTPKTTEPKTHPVEAERESVSDGNPDPASTHRNDTRSNNAGVDAHSAGQVNAANGEALIPSETSPAEIVSDPSGLAQDGITQPNVKPRVEEVDNAKDAEPYDSGRDLNGTGSENGDDTSRSNEGTSLHTEEASPVRNDSLLGTSQNVETGHDVSKFGDSNSSAEDVNNLPGQDTEEVSSRSSAVHSSESQGKDPQDAVVVEQSLDRDNKQLVDVDQGKRNTENSEELT